MLNILGLLIEFGVLEPTSLGSSPAESLFDLVVEEDFPFTEIDLCTPDDVPESNKI